MLNILPLYILCDLMFYLHFRVLFYYLIMPFFCILYVFTVVLIVNLCCFRSKIDDDNCTFDEMLSCHSSFIISSIVLFLPVCIFASTQCTVASFFI